MTTKKNHALRPKGHVPLYGADNALRNWIRPDRAERMEREGLVRVTRRRKDSRIVRCSLHARPSDPSALRRTAYQGTKYHFLEHLSDGHALWQLKRLGKSDELRPIFLRVVTDCLAESRP